MLKFKLPFLSAALISSTVFPTSTLFSQATANTSYWTGAAGDGRWRSTGNWATPTSGVANTLPQNQAIQNKNVLFSNSSGNPTTIDLRTLPNGNLSNSDITLGFTPGSGDLIVREGTFAFDLKGRNLTFADLVLGDGSLLGVAQFINTNATASTVTISNGIVLQSDGGNYQLADLISNLNGNLGSNVILDAGFRNIRIGGVGAGINNFAFVNIGETVSLGALVLNASNTSGSSNNRVEVNGGTLNSGAITVGGYYDSSDPENIIKANNQFLIQQSGTAKVSASLPDLVNIGSGSELRIETGGKLILDDQSSFGLQRNLNIAQHGRLILDGSGSEIRATAAAGYKLNVAGSAEITNGASLGNLGVLSVASTGHALIKDTSVESGGLDISGSAEIENSQFTNAGNITVNNGGHLLVDGSTIEGNGTNQLTTSGGTMEIKNNSQVRAYYLFGSGAGITVEEGSTLHFDKWTTGSLSVQGTAIWGTGEKNGPHPTMDDSHLEATITAGTTLLLGGGNYDLDGEQKIGSGSSAYRVSKAGKFTVQAGAALGGSGNIGGNPNFSGDELHVNNQTFVEVRGGALQPGTKSEAGTLIFSDGVSFLENASQVSFTMFGAGMGEYDQIYTSGLALGAGSVVVKLELGANLLAMSDEEFSQYLSENFVIGETYFQLLAGLDGNAFNISASYESGFSFAFDATSQARLAANGIGWDTSGFLDTGAVGIMAVPEPSTWALIGVGAAVALWRTRKRREERTA